MVRSRGFVRVLNVGFRRAAFFGLLVAMVAPACGGQSIRTEENDEPLPPNVPPEDDGSYGGGGSSGGSVDRGGSGSLSGAFPSGGSYPTGGAFPIGGTTGVGGTGVAGTIGVGGTQGGAFPTGGTSPCGSGSPGGIPAGTAGALPRNSDPECKGIKSNQACVLEGKACPNLVCGLGDSGRRECNCATNWTCSACDYSSSPFRARPAFIPVCTPDVADEVPCTTENQLCGPVGPEYCACFSSCTDGLIWDCDNAPSTWEF